MNEPTDTPTTHQPPSTSRTTTAAAAAAGLIAAELHRIIPQVAALVASAEADAGVLFNAQLADEIAAAAREQSAAEHRAELTICRAGVLREAADAINALPQDDECDPGRGDAAELLRRMADEDGKVTQPAGFFRPGRVYSDSNGYRAPELITLFRVEHITRHPDRGHLRAIGWARNGTPGSPWHGHFLDEDQCEGWTEITETGGER
ncbi:hypothetical protein ACFRNT_14370 [Streptomyces sp. NPDC056697]|uniref:hypothetical protein n=1 Tax=Streptomyces sp. NPDC056697 TaxID=3345915 RepID=UPI0036C2ECC2